MVLIKEPLGVDFVVESRPLTQVEEKALSEFIKPEDVFRHPAPNKTAHHSLAVKKLLSLITHTFQ